MCRLSFPGHVWRGSEREAVTLSLYQLQKMNSNIVSVDVEFVGPVMPDKIPVEITADFRIQISPETKRLVREFSVNERTGAVKFAFLPIKSKKTADVCTLLGCGQADAKKAVRRARKEVGVAWCATMSASVAMSKHLFRSGNIGKSGAVSLTFDAGDESDADMVAELEAKDARVAELEAKLAALEVKA